MLTITPVFEAPWFEGKPNLPWQVAALEALTFIAITSELEDSTIGAFFAMILDNVDSDAEHSALRLFDEVVEEGVLDRSGGLRFQDGTVTIEPGCCGELGAPKEWLEFLSSGEKPWTGHDPAPWATCDGDEVVIWSDGGLDDRCVEPCIRTTRAELEQELATACRVLVSFGELCGIWLRAHKIPKAAEIQGRLVSDFDIASK